MMNRKTGTRQEWLAARRELLKAEKIGTKPAAFSAAGSPLQLTTMIDNLLSDYARPIVVSNGRWTMIRLKWWKRRNRSSRRKSRSLKRWKPDVECNIGARCIGIRAAEPSMGARCIGIPAIEAPCPLICAAAGETAKTHGTMQLRRMNFFEFITLGVSKN